MKRIYIIILSILILALPVTAYANENSMDIYCPDADTAFVAGKEYRIRYNVDDSYLPMTKAIFTSVDTPMQQAYDAAVEVEPQKQKLEDAYRCSLHVSADEGYGVNGTGNYWLWIFAAASNGSEIHGSYIPVRIVNEPKADKEGWFTLEGNKYYGKGGVALTGWQEFGFYPISSRKYYFDETGAMQMGWIQDDNKWYFLQTDGRTAMGWMQSNDEKYFLDTIDGYMFTNWRYIQGKWYYFHPENGKLQTGWQQIDGKRYYLGEDGAMKTGWHQLDGKMYYLAPAEDDTLSSLRFVDGAMYFEYPNGGELLSGWQQIGDKWHYLLEEGGTATSWHKVGSKNYFFTRDGEMQTGWLEYEGNRYYLNPGSGAMLTGTQTIDGTKYLFDNDGKLTGN